MDPIFTKILGLALAFTMWGLGLSLQLADFKRVFVSPKPVLIGLTNQLVLLPIIAFLLLQIFPATPEIAVGLMILSACPGGPSSNLLSYLSKADTALSISLTAITSVLSIVTVPFVVNLGLVHFGGLSNIELNVSKMVLTLIILVLVPLIIGMIVNRYKPSFSSKMAKPVRIISALVLAFIIVMIVISENENIIEYYRQAGILAILLNILTMGLGVFTARIFHLNNKQALTIALDSGIQNATMALTIAGTVLMDTAYGITAAVYGLSMYVTSFLLIYWLKNKE